MLKLIEDPKEVETLWRAGLVVGAKGTTWAPAEEYAEEDIKFFSRKHANVSAYINLEE